MQDRTANDQRWNDPSNFELTCGRGNGELTEVNGIRGHLSEGDVRFMWNVGLQLPPGGTYLEIGSLMGLSAILVARGALARGNGSASIVCVDLWNGAFERGCPDQIQESVHEQFLSNIESCGVAHMMTPLQGDSARLFSHFDDYSIDCIFIDGDHSYQRCFDDILHWHPKLKVDGLMIGHDATPGSEVRQAVHDYCVTRQLSYSIYSDPCHYIWQISSSGRRKI
jgi:predicted O-methyltransferase YrrM